MDESSYIFRLILQAEDMTKSSFDAVASHFNQLSAVAAKPIQAMDMAPTIGALGQLRERLAAVASAGPVDMESQIARVAGSYDKAAAAVQRFIDKAQSAGRVGTGGAALPPDMADLRGLDASSRATVASIGRAMQQAAQQDAPELAAALARLSDEAKALGVNVRAAMAPLAQGGGAGMGDTLKTIVAQANQLDAAFKALRINGADPIATAWQSAGNAITGVATKVRDVASSMGTIGRLGLAPVFAGLASSLSDASASSLPLVGHLAAAHSSTVGMIAGFGTLAAVNLAHFIGPLVSGLQHVASLAPTVLAGLSGAGIAAAGRTVPGVQLIIDILDALAVTAVRAGAAVINQLNTIAVRAQMALGDVTTGAINALRVAWDSLGNAAMVAGSLIGTALDRIDNSGLMGGAISAIRTFVTTLRTIGQEGNPFNPILLGAQRVTGVIRAMGMEVGGVFSTIAMRVREAFTAPFSYAMERVHALGASIAGMKQFAMGTLVGGLGLTAIYDAAHGIEQLGAMAITTNSNVEQLRNQLGEVYAEAGQGPNFPKAQQALDWLNQFSMHAPYSIDAIRAAASTINSLGQNITEVLPQLANVASVMNTDLPTAAQAFLDAYEGRFFMMQRRLRVSKEMLIPFGLKIEPSGHVDQSSFVAAFEAFAKSRFPQGTSIQMNTMQGILSNLKDQLIFFAQGIGNAGTGLGGTGGGPFDAIKGHLRDLQNYLWSKPGQDQIKALEMALGKGLTAISNFAFSGGKFLAEYIPRALTILHNAWDGMVPPAVKAFDMIRAKAGDLAGWIVANVLPRVLGALDAMAGFWRDHGAFIVRVLQIAANNIQAAFNWIGQTAIPALGKILALASTWWGQHASQVLGVLQVIGTNVAAAFNFVVNNAIPTVREVLNQAGHWWREHGKQVEDALSTIGATVVNFVTYVVQNWSGLWQMLTSMFGLFYNTFTGLWNMLFGSKGDLATRALHLSDTVVGSFLDMAGGLAKALLPAEDKIAAIWTDIARGAYDFVAMVSDAMANVPATIVYYFDEAKNKVIDGMNTLINLNNKLAGIGIFGFKPLAGLKEQTIPKVDPAQDYRSVYNWAYQGLMASNSMGIKPGQAITFGSTTAASIDAEVAKFKKQLGIAVSSAAPPPGKGPGGTSPDDWGTLLFISFQNMINKSGGTLKMPDRPGPPGAATKAFTDLTTWLDKVMAAPLMGKVPPGAPGGGGVPAPIQGLVAPGGTPGDPRAQQRAANATLADAMSMFKTDLANRAPIPKFMADIRAILLDETLAHKSAAFVTNSHLVLLAKMVSTQEGQFNLDRRNGESQDVLLTDINRVEQAQLAAGVAHHTIVAEHQKLIREMLKTGLLSSQRIIDQSRPQASLGRLQNTFGTTIVQYGAMANPRNSDAVIIATLTQQVNTLTRQLAVTQEQLAQETHIADNSDQMVHSLEALVQHNEMAPPNPFHRVPLPLPHVDLSARYLTR